jgi:hypothetical protein
MRLTIHGFLGGLAVVACGACGSSSGGGDEGIQVTDRGGPLDIHYGDTAEPTDDGIPPLDGEDPGTTPVDAADPGAPPDPGQDSPFADPGAQDTSVQNDPGATDEGSVDPGPLCDVVTSLFGFRDNCDGTVTDTNTGWTWEKSFHWAAGLDEAKKACADSRTGGFNTWRLPTIDELRSLILQCPATVPAGTCPVHALANCIDESCRNDSCNGCATNQGPVEKPDDPSRKCYLDGSFEWYCNLFWSETQVKAKVAGDKRSWYVTFYDAGINVPPSMAQIQSWALRCVR